MAKKKKNVKGGWLVWHEDIQGEGAKVVFTKKKDLDEVIASQLDYIIGGVEKEVVASKKAGSWDEFHGMLEEVSKNVRKALDAGDVSGALEIWRDFEEEDEQASMESWGTVHVEAIEVV